MYLNQSAGDANVWSHPFNAHDFESGHFCILPLKRTASPPWTIGSNPTGFFTNLTWQHFRRECFIVSKQLMQNIWTNNIYINKKSIRNIKHIYKKATNYTGKKNIFQPAGKNTWWCCRHKGQMQSPAVRYSACCGGYSPSEARESVIWEANERQVMVGFFMAVNGGQPNSPNAHPAPEIRVNSRTY